ncbi:RNA polymerase sigma factor [Peristeroidobacter soli]|uniref:RNA polymerase sigma factor n=1 Tax=Peristeroidobacter soli TaxID=2497877 RepID=UPI00101B729B|nr:RNA polymerase sigma factor [Peristeroidobacter soli]
MTAKTRQRLPSPAKPALAQYQQALHRYLMRRLRSSEDAADLAQEVYLRMLRVENSELVRSPLDYLYGIASHVVYQFRLRSQRELVTFDSETVAQVSENPRELVRDEVADRLEAQQQLTWALEQLPPTHRIVLLLRKRDRLSDRQIAERLNLSVHTVKKYLFQAQARMRTLWNPNGADR